MASSVEQQLCSAFKLTTTKHESNMMLFNHEGKLRKYEDVSEILDEFYKVRIDFYAQRKASLMKGLTGKLLVAKNRTRFIREIVSGELVIAARKKVDIENELATRGFDKAAVGNGDVSFAYLLNMSLTTLTAEKIEELERQQTLESAEHAAVAKKTVEAMYVDDLDENLRILER